MEKLNMQFTEDSIATNTDFNVIEMKLYDVRNAIYNLGFTSIPSYTAKSWSNNDFLLYTYLNNIEQGIYNCGKYYFKPYGWQDTKIWTAGMGFSYRDMNRWVSDINLIIERINTESNTLFHSNTLYPSETLFPH